MQRSGGPSRPSGAFSWSSRSGRLHADPVMALIVVKTGSRRTPKMPTIAMKTMKPRSQKPQKPQRPRAQTGLSRATLPFPSLSVGALMQQDEVPRQRLKMKNRGSPYEQRKRKSKDSRKGRRESRQSTRDHGRASAQWVLRHSPLVVACLDFPHARLFALSLSFGVFDISDKRCERSRCC